VEQRLLFKQPSTGTTSTAYIILEQSGRNHSTAIITIKQGTQLHGSATEAAADQQQYPKTSVKASVNYQVR
jgi:hypothetical protein